MSNKQDIDSLIRIVTIDSNVEESALLRRYIEGNRDFELIYQAYSGKEGHTICNRLNPDVILIARNLLDINDIDLLKALCIDCRLSGIIMMSVSNEPIWTSKVIQAGGRFFLGRPVDKQQLYQFIYAAYEWAEEVRKLLADD